MMNSDSTAFRTSLALVLDEIKNIKELRQPARKLIQFAIDVCLVAHGVRAGYLVDTVFPPNPEQLFAALLKALRGKSTVFKHVMWWHHIPTMQSFLVHTSLLEEKLTTAGVCVFIRLDKCLSVSKEPHNRLQEALNDVRFSMTESPDALALSLSDAFTEEILIPLAAVMIDYPVAYSPVSSAQTSFLEEEALDIYTISFTETTPSDATYREHLLLKFSCPQHLVGDYAELSPGTLIKNLEVKFAARLERIGMHILITHRTETLDRVAL